MPEQILRPIIWAVAPQFNRRITDAQRAKKQGELDHEFLQLSEQHPFTIHPRYLAPGRKLSIEDIDITFPTDVSKGVGVRLAIASILHRIDADFGTNDRRRHFLLMIDGTGSYIGQTRYLIEALQRVPAVLGRRIGSSGMSAERTLIEAFEKYLLEERFVCKMSDCQAGIWAARMDVFQEVSLTDSWYGLEFDFAAGVLQNYVPFEFVDVRVSADRLASAFVPASPAERPDYVKPSIQKLRFIVTRLSLNWDTLASCWSRFEKDALPEEYANAVAAIVEARAWPCV